jgi:DNA repair exonuclease SbcCD ATPase subunit
MAYSHIVHLADIHIRTGNHEVARVQEYTNVLKQLKNDLKKLPCIKNQTALIVLCGDIFHNKTKLESTTIKLWNLYRRTLQKLAPVVIICGNHDYRQEDSAGDTSFPDIIEVLVENNDGDSGGGAGGFPLTYLSETGIYEMENLVFSLVSIKDTLKSWDSHGIREDLPVFPIAEQHPGKLNVGLFHGTITQSALPNGQRMAAGKGYPLEWFKGVDLLLLGDNHKQQVNVSKWGMPWGYPGSLIQQDHGEPVHGHGYILWDCESINGCAAHVANDHGYFKSCMQDGKCKVKCDARGFVPLEDVVCSSWFPKAPSVIVVGNVGEEVDVKREMEKYEIVPASLITNLNVFQAAGGVDSSDGGGACTETFLNELAMLNHPSKWLEYMGTSEPALAEALQRNQWLENPEAFVMEPVESRLSADLASKVTERREKLMGAIQAHRKLQEKQVVKSSIVLKHLKWSWALSYGEKNYFDFEAMEGNIGLLNGANASGKSAFVDVLSMALFGEPTKCRSANTGRKMSSHYIHNQRPAKSSLMNVTLLFEMNGEMYEVHRSYINATDKSGLAQVRDCTLSKVNREENTKIPVERVFTATDVDNWVARHCGTIDDTFMTAIVNQFDNANFFNAKPADQKAIIDHALNMEAFKSYADVVHQAVLAYNSLIGTCSTILNTLDGGDAGDAGDLGAGDEASMARDLKEQRTRIEELSSLRDSLFQKASKTPPRCDSKEYWQSQIVENGNFAEFVERRAELVTKCKHVSHSMHSHCTDEELTESLREIESNPALPPCALSSADLANDVATLKTWLDAVHYSPTAVDVYHKWASLKDEMHAAVINTGDVMCVNWQDACAEFAQAKQDEGRAQAKVMQHDRVRPVVQRSKQGQGAWKERLVAWQELIEEAIDAEWPSVEECKQFEKVSAKKAKYEIRNYALERSLNDALSKLAIENRPEWLAQMQAWQTRVSTCDEQGWTDIETVTEAYVKVDARRTAKIEMQQRLEALRLQHDADHAWEKEWKNWEAKVAKAAKRNWLSSSQCRELLKNAEGREQLWHSLQEKLERVEAEHGELSKHPYNPSCKACAAHPCHKRMVALELELADTRQKLDDIGGGIEQVTKEVAYWTKGLEASMFIESKQPWIEERRAAHEKCEADAKLLKKSLKSKEYANVDEEFEYWAKAKQEITSIHAEKPLMESRIRAHTEETRALEDIVRETKAELESVTERIAKLENDLNGVDWERAVEVQTYIKKHRASMEREEAEWEQAAMQWDELDAWEQESAILRKELADCVELKTQLQNNAYASWSAAREEVEAARDVAMEWPAREREHASLKLKLQQALAWEEWESLKHEQATRELGFVDAQIEAHGALAWLQEREIKEQLVSLQEASRCLATQLGMLERTQGVRNKRQTDVSVLHVIHQRWMQTRDLLQKISGCLVGAEVRGATVASSSTFTEWMYIRYILPLFESQINRFLMPIESIRVNVQYTTKSINFFIHDRGNVVTLSACSGYQKFIIGLGVRQALSNIGGGCNLKHMIIDEGFTACDEANLSKVEAVLRHLVHLGNYRSILLVSHLESIKDAITLKIPVRREGAFSSMRFGSEYPALSFANAVATDANGLAKRRGRPKKA